jgi:hypothetical protein
LIFLFNFSHAAAETGLEVDYCGMATGSGVKSSSTGFSWATNKMGSGTGLDYQGKESCFFAVPCLMLHLLFWFLLYFLFVCFDFHLSCSFFWLFYCRQTIE